MYIFKTHLWIFLPSRGHRVYEEGYAVGYTVICSGVFCRGLDQMTLQGDLVSFKSTSCVYTQSHLRQASQTTEAGIKARCIPHVPVVLLPSGKLQDQIGKSVPGLGAKFGEIRGWFTWLRLESTPYVLLWPSLALGFLTHFKWSVSGGNRWAPPTGIRGVSSKSCGTLRQLNCPPLYSKVQKTCNAGAVRAKELDVQVLSRSCQK